MNISTRARLWMMAGVLGGCLPEIQLASHDASTTDLGVDTDVPANDILVPNDLDARTPPADSLIVVDDGTGLTDAPSDHSPSSDLAPDASLNDRPPSDAGTMTPSIGVDLSAGDSHTCALAAQGQVYCWGTNSFLRPEPGAMDLRRTTPTDTGVVVMSGDIQGGSNYSCIGSIVAVTCWGNALFGEMDPMSSLWSTRTLEGVNMTTSIRAGAGHLCILERSGAVWCVGHNARGQLGDGSLTRRPHPVRVGELTDGTTLAAGGEHTCATTRPDALWCWGHNEHGQLGLGDTNDRSRPALVNGVHDIAELAAGTHHTCARTRMGTVFCWGSNEQGQLGDGTTTSRMTPQRVVGLDDALHIVAGGAHSCAIRGQGSVVCWGSNADGQLGSSAPTSRPSPTPVSGLANVRILAAGGRHTCARRADRTLMCWGYNGNGQLGDGTTNSRNAPGLVVGFP